MAIRLHYRVMLWVMGILLAGFVVWDTVADPFGYRYEILNIESDADGLAEYLYVRGTPEPLTSLFVGSGSVEEVYLIHWITVTDGRTIILVFTGVDGERYPGRGGECRPFDYRGDALADALLADYQQRTAERIRREALAELRGASPSHAEAWYPSC